MVKPIILIQTRPNGHILNQGCYTAFYGAQQLNYITEFYKNADDCFEKIKQHAFPGTVCVGGIDTLRKIMDMIGCAQPEVHSPHTHLPYFVGRKITETTLGEIRSNKFKPPYFIKPLVLDKAFTGYVVHYHDMDLIRVRSLADDTKILHSETVKFVSEYRIFIKNKIIIGAKNYSGRYDVLPDFEIVRNAINHYVDQKICYSLDFGITDKGETLLIEINDAFGMAPYGLEPVAYLNFLSERWREITIKKPTTYSI